MKYAPRENAGILSAEQPSALTTRLALGGAIPLGLGGSFVSPAGLAAVTPRSGRWPVERKVADVSLLLRRLTCIGGLAGLVATAACTTSPTLVPPSTTVPATIENFSGTVPVRGSSAHAFSVKKSNGQMTVSLVSAGAPDRVIMLLGLGIPSGTVCTVLPGASMAAIPGAGTQFDVVAQAGTYCVVVSDNGSQTAPVNYVVQVTHY